MAVKRCQATVPTRQNVRDTTRAHGKLLLNGDTMARIVELEMESASSKLYSRYLELATCT